MKKLFIVIFGALTVFFLSVTKSYAFNPGAEFLLFGIGARPSGMGEAFVSISDDVTAPFWNPAGLASLKKSEFGAMHSEVLQQIASQGFLGFCKPFSNLGTFGFNVILLRHEPVPVTFTSPEPIGDHNKSDYAFIFSNGRRVSDDFSTISISNQEMLSSFNSL